jgi:hypothetical protein
MGSIAWDDWPEPFDGDRYSWSCRLMFARDHGRQVHRHILSHSQKEQFSATQGCLRWCRRRNSPIGLGRLHAHIPLRIDSTKSLRFLIGV